MEQQKMKELASLFEQVSKDRDGAVALMNANGNFIEFMDPKTLTQDPKFTAKLILSAKYGYPCEALGKVTSDVPFLLEVAKYIVSENARNLDWVTEHMFRGDRNAYAFLSNFIEQNLPTDTSDIITPDELLDDGLKR